MANEKELDKERKALGVFKLLSVFRIGCAAVVIGQLIPPFPSPSPERP